MTGVDESELGGLLRDATRSPGAAGPARVTGSALCLGGAVDILGDPRPVGAQPRTTNSQRAPSRLLRASPRSVTRLTRRPSASVDVATPVWSQRTRSAGRVRWPAGCGDVPLSCHGPLLAREVASLLLHVDEIHVHAAAKFASVGTEA